MSLLVAMSIFEIEQDLKVNNENGIMNGRGACLMKILEKHSYNSSSSRNQKELLDLTTPLLVGESDEIYEILTAATPKRFSNLVKTNIYGLMKKQTSLKLSKKTQVKVMYQGRDLLDLGSNLRQKELVQPSRNPAIRMTRDILPEPIVYQCPDCQFDLYHYN